MAKKKTGRGKKPKKAVVRKKSARNKIVKKVKKGNSIRKDREAQAPGVIQGGTEQSQAGGVSEEKLEGERHESGHAHSIYYVCEGGCGAKLNEQEWHGHATKVCGTDGCAHKGIPFVRKEWCDACVAYCGEQGCC